MRKELELIEQIENYLMNKLSGADKTAFDAKMATDAGFKSDVEFQQNLVEGIQRMGLKNDTVNARRKYRFKKILKRVGITLVIVGAIAAAAYYYTVNTEGAWDFSGSNEAINSERIEQVEAIPSIIIPENDAMSGEANNYLDQELFEIQTGRDTVIESEEGIVVYIPANAFDTQNDQIDFLIQEALTPADILYAGLNTMTEDGKELETGGMFYFDAFADGERILLSKELTVDIPSNPDKTGMQLYDGVENETSELLWTNPTPLTTPLIAVEITELDFYPRRYEPKMEEWGYLNKQFKDSLYYSFADECGLDDELQPANSGLDLPEPVFQNINDRNVSTTNPIGMFMLMPQEDEMVDTIYYVQETATEEGSSNDCVECGVNPASVKTIWNSKFNNTNLATKEFEARMPVIHQTCNNAVLEIYINNLDKNLCTVDSMAARMSSGGNKRAFLKFASQGCGKVAVSTLAQKELNAYYALKKQALQTAIAQTNTDFWEEEDRLNAEMSRQDLEAQNRERGNKRSLNKQEVEFNTAEVYVQLGLQKQRPRSTRPIVFNSNQSANLGNLQINLDSPDQEETIRIPTIPIRPNRSFLRANINSTGWKNIDCLMSVSTARKDAKIRGSNGRTATINYSNMTLNLTNASNYERINVYVVPTQFNSYVKLPPNEGVYKYELNDRLSYSIIAIAWNNEGMFYTKTAGEPGANALQLLPITKAEWEGEIKASLRRINSMTDELDYLEYAKKDQNRKNKNSAKRNLRNKARPYVFPCKCDLDTEVEIEVDDLLDSFSSNDNQTNTIIISENWANDTSAVSSLSFPNVITPNGDLKNDFFAALHANLRTFTILIYEENGSSIFGTENVNFRWRGTDKTGNPAPDGLYSYTATAIGLDGVDQGIKGTVRLIRE